MKTRLILILFLFCFLISNAQEQSPIPIISEKLSSYFDKNENNKIFIVTDKANYKPGETIWFRTFIADINNQYLNDPDLSIEIGLYSSEGSMIKKDYFKQKEGFVYGDLLIPEESTKGNYFLIANIEENPKLEDLFYRCITVDPVYKTQFQINYKLTDSISVAGKNNLITIRLQTLSGDIQKNFRLNYKLVNGTQNITEGKLKTDEKGAVSIPFSLPEKTNGQPFFIELFDNRNFLLKQIYIPSNIDPLIVEFYPEGSSVGTGINTKMGFTAFTKWGTPVNIEGHIIDQNKQNISNIRTFAAGLGLFSITAENTKSLYLKTGGPNYAHQTFELPKSDETGLSVSITRFEPDFISVNLIFSDKQNHTIAITVTNGNSLYWAGDLEINGTGRIKIPTENFPQGVNNLSVFDNKGNLLAERLFFTDKNKQLNVLVNTETKTASENDKLTFKINLTDENNNPVSGNISLSVSETNKTDFNETDLYRFLNFEAGFKSPFSLIADAFKTRITNSALLDVFMIANKITHFDWAKILNYNPSDTISIDESSLIKGTVTDKNGAIVPKATIKLLNSQKVLIFSTTTRPDGTFLIPNINTNEYTINATDLDGKRELTVSTDKKITSVQSLISDIELKHRISRKDILYTADYLNQNSFLFPKEVKTPAPNTSRQDNIRNMLSTSTNLMDVIKVLKPYKIVNNQIVFFGSENSINYQGGALLVLDGQQLGTDISAIQNISPMEVDRINVSTNPMDIQRYTGLNSVGIVEIFLKRAKMLEEPKTTFGKDLYDGQFRIANNFKEVQAKLKDNASTTLMWIPDAKIGSTGELEFTVNTGKVISEFKIQVHAVSENGTTGSGSTVFSIVK